MYFGWVLHPSHQSFLYPFWAFPQVNPQSDVCVVSMRGILLVQNMSARDQYLYGWRIVRQRHQEFEGKMTLKTRIVGCLIFAQFSCKLSKEGAFMGPPWGIICEFYSTFLPECVTFHWEQWCWMSPQNRWPAKPKQGAKYLCKKLLLLILIDLPKDCKADVIFDGVPVKSIYLSVNFITCLKSLLLDITSRSPSTKNI